MGRRVPASNIDFSKFADITYKSFRRRASDPSLSRDVTIACHEAPNQLPFANRRDGIPVTRA